MASCRTYFLITTAFMLSGYSLIKAEIKRIDAVIPDLQCSYGARGVAQRIKQHTWFKNLTSKNQSKGLVEVTLTHNNTVSLESMELALQDATEKTNYRYDGIRRLLAWGTIKHGKSGYFLQISGSQDTIYLLEEHHKPSSFLRKAFNTVKEFFTGSEEKTRKKIEHLCAENCPVRLCATVHRHDDRTYGATKIIHLDAQQ